MNQLSKFHAPSEHHWGAVKRLLRYLNRTRNLGICQRSSSPLSLHGFSDADWAGNLNDHTSTGAYVFFLGVNPIFWSSTKQRTVSRSSTEAEYHAITSVTAQMKWVESLLRELGVYLPFVSNLYTDNILATYLCASPVFHSRIKHLELTTIFL